MPRELIHVDQSRVTWSQAVAQVASALNPLGHAAQIVAELSACIVELRQLEVEIKRVNAHRAIIEQSIVHRQQTVAAIFEERRRQTHGVQVTIAALREAFSNAVRLTTDRYISEDERILAHGTVQTLTAGMAQLHAQESNNLIQLSRILLSNKPLLTLRRWREIGP